VGPRFNDHGLPLELLEEIGALEDVTIELAKWLYLKNNPNRKRIPRGFTNGISIQLDSIESGSTILPISLFIASSGLFPSSKLEYFEHASKHLVNAIQAAENKQDVTEYMPEELLSYFNKIGRKLQSNESIEFTPKNVTKARLTKETRKRLILASTKAKDYLDEVTIRGYISEMDKAKNTFQIQQLDNQRITGKFSDNFVSDLQDAFNNFENKQLVKIVGTGEFTRYDKIETVKLIESFEFLDEKDVPSRLQSLGLLKDGWLDGEGKAINNSFINWFSDEFERNFSPELPLPFLYPTLDGGIQAEWSINNNELSVIINPDQNIGLLHNLSIIDDEEMSFEIFFDVKGWEKLNSFIAKLIGSNEG